MDVDETTLEYYSKQGFFAPSNPDDLRVQLQTTVDMLELLTCPMSNRYNGTALCPGAQEMGTHDDRARRPL